MALTVTHAFESAEPAHASKIDGPKWNADHVLEGDYLRKATVTLSSAQILALHTTPVTLVAAPGAGQYIIPHAIVVWVGYVTTPYTVSDDLSIRYVTGDDISLDAATAAVFNFSGFRKLLLLDDIAGDDGIVNKGIEMYVRAGALTGGDGTLTVTVWYAIEDVP